MKKMTLFILTLFFISCNPFDENQVLEYQEDLNDLVIKLEQYDNGSYDRDEIDEFIIGDIRKLDIDVVIKNYGKKNPSYSGFVEENDSLIILVNRSGSIIDNERRIIFDLNKKPRNFGNDTIIGASYRIVQLDERWYYSEIGFD